MRYSDAPDGFMTHIAMYETPDGQPRAVWGEHVNDEEYTTLAPENDRMR